MWIIYSILTLCVFGALVLFYMHFIEPKKLYVRKVDIQGNVKKDVRIAHISDTHFRSGFGAEKAQEIVTKIQGLHPDIIVFTGDFMDFYDKTKAFKDTLPPLFEKLQAPYGKYAIYGNHDIGGGAKHVYATMMKDSGFHLLFNDNIEIQELGIAFFGVDDNQLGYADVKLCDKQLQPYQILLSHEPDFIDEIDCQHIHLALCGHTHGGQVALPILKNIILPKGGRCYRKGLYHKQNMKIFVSSGIGTTKLRLRFGNVPEICLLKIHK